MTRASIAENLAVCNESFQSDATAAESRGVLEQSVQQLSLRSAALNLAVADTVYASHHVDVTLLPQEVYLRARKVATAPTGTLGAPWRAAEEVSRSSPALMFNMNATDDVSRVLDDVQNLRQNQHHQQNRLQQQRRAQTSYAKSNTNPLPSHAPVKHIGSMRILADPRIELPLVGGSRVVVCRGSAPPTPDRFPIPHASVSRHHAVVDVGADGTCRRVSLHTQPARFLTREQYRRYG
jgi:hypothetical protein